MKNVITKYLFWIYITISLIAYYATEGAGMIFDFNSWTSHYQTGTYKDVLNSFGYQGLHQVEQFAFFSIYKIFKFNTFAWYLIFAFLHGSVSYVSYLFVVKWLKTINFNNAQTLALLSSFLFLISPFATDTVVNKVTIHYLLSNLFIYLSLYFLVLYYDTNKYKNLVYVFLLFILALFSLEISYVFPILFIIVWVSLFFFNKSFRQTKKLLLPIIFPIIIFIAFLFLHKIMLGGFIGHYGADVHLKFNFPEVFATVVRYFSSYILLFDYWNYKYKILASEILVNYSYLLFVLMITFFSLITFLALKKNKKEWILILIVFLLAVFSIAPISNLYFAYLFPIENDRYSYLMSLFAYLFIVLLFFQIKLEKLKILIISLFIILNINFTIENIINFSKASKLSWSLLNDFRWFDKEVVILVDPNNVQGVKMFGTSSDTTSFSVSLKLHTGKDRRAHIKSVYQMNFVNLTDSVKVEKIDKYNYKVELAQWGNWYWKNTIGANSFENEWCKTELVKEGMHYYNLEIKDTITDYVFIYTAGDKWREAK